MFQNILCDFVNLIKFVYYLNLSLNYPKCYFPFYNLLMLLLIKREWNHGLLAADLDLYYFPDSWVVTGSQVNFNKCIWSRFVYLSRNSLIEDSWQNELKTESYTHGWLYSLMPRELICIYRPDSCNVILSL